MSDRKISRRAFFYAGAGAVGGGLFIKGRYLEPESIEIIEVPIRSAKIKKEITLVQLSDLHIDPKHHYKKIPQIVNSFSPDLIALTGDYMNRKPPEEPPIEILDSFISELKSKHGIFACYGNWDVRLIDRLFLNSPVKTLSNSIASVEVGEDKINIVGLDYIGADTNLLLELDSEIFNLLLCHTPDLIEDIAPLRKTDLYLAGHTHGGQIRVPFLNSFGGNNRGKFPYSGAVVTVSKFGIKYAFGRHQVDQTTLYVNRGIGMTRLIAMRLFCAPEITVFRLTPAGAIG